MIEGKEVYDINDLMKIFDCSINVAQRIKREIKAVSDITHNVRTVHRIDYENYLESKKIKAETKYKEIIENIYSEIEALKGMNHV